MLFIFSYACADKSPYLEKFYTDLVEEVRKVSGCSPETVIAFRDEGGLETGKRWTNGLTRALAECRVFVYLHSPTYFERDYCGREFEVFTRRLEARFGSWESPTGTPSLLQPVLWIPTNDDHLTAKVPASIKTLQRTHADDTADYRNDGLELFMQTTPIDYARFKRRLAARIWEAAKSDMLPKASSVESIETVSPLFPIRNPNRDSSIPTTTTACIDIGAALETGAPHADEELSDYHVLRPNLCQSIRDAFSTGSVAVLVAPDGFGKSALAAEYKREFCGRTDIIMADNESDCRRPASNLAQFQLLIIDKLDHSPDKFVTGHFKTDMLWSLQNRQVNE